MKLNQKLKLVLIILLIILISLIGFIGVYAQNKNLINNMLPEYLLSMELKGYRKIELKMSSETNTLKYDAEGKEISESDTETQVARTEEKKVNDDNVKNAENYKKVKQIIEQRLERMHVEEYYIRQAENSENIIVQIPENDKTDDIVAQLQLQGKFEIVDKDTNEVLMTNNDIEKVEARYGSTSYGTTVFLNIQFNKEGKEKFKNITNTYVEVEEEKTEESENSDTSINAKEIIIEVDDSELITTHFNEEISNGILQLSVGSSTNSTYEELQEYYEQANSMAALLDSGKMPIIYEVNQNKYIQTDITSKEIVTGIAVLIITLTILLIIMVIRGKGKGILASIVLIGYIATLLITLRYTNVTISIEGMVAIVASILLEYVFLLSILKSKQDEFWKIYVKYIWILIPLAVIAVTFALTTKYLPISSFGMVIFWGIITKLIWNAVITRNILDIKK